VTQTRSPARETEHPLGDLRPPGGRGGLVDVFRRRYLLSLLVRKEIRVRYQGSVLGLFWSYVRPLLQFTMYFLVLGVILGLRKNVEDFPIHIFSGMVVVHFFNDTFNNGTRSVVRNKALIRKIRLPREMFPVASLLVSAYHAGPTLLILVAGSFISGWHPSPVGLAAFVLGTAVIIVFAMAVALTFSACNVFYRDFQNLVDTIGILIVWSVPMIYPFSRVVDSAPTWFVNIYLSNPLAIAVLLYQRCFWVDSTNDPKATVATEMPDHLFARGLGMLALAVILLVIAQAIFHRLEGRFAERI
jgi:ABC-2 type transport system permease protein